MSNFGRSLRKTVELKNHSVPNDTALSFNIFCVPAARLNYFERWNLTIYLAVSILNSNIQDELDTMMIGNLW